MVDSVSSLTKAIASLRSRMLATSKTTGPTKGPRRSATSGQSIGQSGPEDSHVSTLAARLTALSGDRSSQSKAAIRLFVEAVLLDEFGTRYVLAPDFHAMVEKVASTMEADPTLSHLIVDSLQELWVLPPTES
jgi:hypothetical protein